MPYFFILQVGSTFLQTLIALTLSPHAVMIHTVNKMSTLQSS